MPADVSLHSGNYVRSVFYGVKENGLLLGSTATAPTAGDQDGSIMAQLRWVKNWPLQPVSSDRPNQLGDGGVAKRFINRPNELPSDTATFGAADKTFQALCQSMIKRNVGGGQFVPVQPKSPTYRDFFFMVQAPSQSDETASLDEEMWEGTIYLGCKVDPKGRTGYSTNGLPDYAYDIVTNYGARHIWGEALVAGTDGDTEMVAVDFTWPYQLIFQRFTLDGTETTFNLGKQLAEDSADNIVVFRYSSGTVTELTWIAATPGATEFEADTSANTLTLGAGGTSGDSLVVGFGFSGS